MVMCTFLEVLTTLSAALFSGAAIYINLVEHPARTECGVHLAVTEFRASYKKGAVFMGSLLMIGCLCAAAVWLLNSNAWWLIGASFLLIPIPYTLVFILPINKRLLATNLQNGADLELNLLMRWGKL